MNLINKLYHKYKKNEYHSPYSALVEYAKMTLLKIPSHPTA